VQRVVVTGGAGFIGTHSVDALLREGWEVMVIDDLSHRSSRPLSPDAQLLSLDIRSTEAHRAIVDARPQAVLHLAAQGGVNRSWRDPMADAAINVLGTLNVLRATADAGCERLVMASSGGALYGQAARLPSPENTMPAPRSPYGTSKLAAEAYLGTWSRITGLSGLALRYGNVYGPGQDGTGEAGVVAITCTRLLQGLPPVLRGDGEQTRDFVYVADVAAANVAALAAACTGSLNVGTGVQTEVRSVVQRLASFSGFTQECERTALPAGEVRHSCLAVEAAAQALGWRASTPIAHGLALTWEDFARARD
jgi:UDP-glucose 4-epimerase